MAFFRFSPVLGFVSTWHFSVFGVWAATPYLPDLTPATAVYGCKHSLGDLGVTLPFA